MLTTRQLADAILGGAHIGLVDLRSVLDLTDDEFGLLKALAGEQWKGDDETWEHAMDRQRQAEKINLHSRALRRAQSAYTFVVDNPEGVEVRGMAFDRIKGRTEQFMLDGNGPTTYACFVYNPDGDGGETLSHAYLLYADSGEVETAIIPQYRAEQMYAVLKGYR